MQRSISTPWPTIRLPTAPRLEVAPTQMNVEVVGGVSELDASQWNRLNGRDYPFLRHEFMAAAEAGCVSPESGWTPLHLALFDGGDMTAMP